MQSVKGRQFVVDSDLEAVLAFVQARILAGWSVQFYTASQNCNAYNTE
jgi:hypothetical protein